MVLLISLTFDHSLLWELQAAQLIGSDEHQFAYVPKNVHSVVGASSGSKNRHSSSFRTFDRAISFFCVQTVYLARLPMKSWAK